MADTRGPYVQPFSAAGATEVACAGGKGATLARLFQAGLPVPPGCVLSPEACTAFLAAQHVSFTSSPEDICQVLRTALPPAALETELRAALAAVPVAPHGWAVRSSAVSEDHATTSYAGVYESFLEIPHEDLWAYIRACWASWWSERAVAYRRQVGETDAMPRMAVVLQHMVPARCAGVAFTAEPLQGDRTRMVINAAPGCSSAHCASAWRLSVAARRTSSGPGMARPAGLSRADRLPQWETLRCTVQTMSGAMRI